MSSWSLLTLAGTITKQYMFETKSIFKPIVSDKWELNKQIRECLKSWDTDATDNREPVLTLSRLYKQIEERKRKRDKKMPRQLNVKCTQQRFIKLDRIIIE